MKTTLENLSPILQCITVETLAEAVDKAFAAAMKEIQKDAKVPGFRKGKVPDKIIERRYAEDLSLEAIKKLIKDTYVNALKETGANPIDEPRIEPVGKIEKSKPFTYKATFEIYPEVTAKDYEGLKLEKEKIEVIEKEIEAELTRLQTQMTQLEPSPDGELGPGMLAMIDFKGTAGGKPFPGSDAQNYVVDFGSGQLLPEFEAQIKGMKAKDEREITFKYPEDYFKKEISGKGGKFNVKMKDLRKKIVPELNDDFAKELGKYTTLNEVRQDVEKRIHEYKETLAKNGLRETAIRDLIARHKDLEVPTVLVDAELRNMLNQMENQLRSKGSSLAEIKFDTQKFVEANLNEARDRARGYMVANAIARQEKIEISNAEVDARIEIIAAQGRETPVKVRQHLEKNKLMTNLQGQMLFEKTLDFVLSKAKISEKSQKLRSKA